jgi:hypothetical protein
LPNPTKPTRTRSSGAIELDTQAFSMVYAASSEVLLFFAVLATAAIQLQVCRVLSYSAYSVSEFSDNEVQKIRLQRIIYPLTYSSFIRQQSALPDNEVLEDFVFR